MGVLAAMIVPISSPNISMIALASCGYCNMQGRTILNCSATASGLPLMMALYCSSSRVALTQERNSGETVSNTIDIEGGIGGWGDTATESEVGSGVCAGAISLTVTGGVSVSFPPPQATTNKTDVTIAIGMIKFSRFKVPPQSSNSDMPEIIFQSSRLISVLPENKPTAQG